MSEDTDLPDGTQFTTEQTCPYCGDGVPRVDASCDCHEDDEE